VVVVELDWSGAGGGEASISVTERGESGVAEGQGPKMWARSSTKEEMRGPGTLRVGAKIMPTGWHGCVSLSVLER